MSIGAMPWQRVEGGRSGPGTGAGAGHGPTPQVVAAPSAVALPGRWVVLAVLLAAPFLAVLDAFIVMIAIPTIQDRLHASDAGAQLVVAGYAVAYAAFLITGGRLGDIYGRKRLLVTGLIFFSGTSLLGASAADQETLVAARFLQGMSAALMYPQTLALMRVHFHGRDLRRATAAFGVTLGIAAVAAQLAGGLILQANLLGLGWRSIFLVNVPIGLAAAVLVLVLVKESRAGRRSQLDVAGVVLVTLSLVALVFPLVVGRESGWAPWTWSLLATAGIIGILFLRHERRLTERGLAPLVSLDLFRIRAFVVGLAMTLSLYGGQISFFLLLSLYLQHGLGLDPLTTGLLFAPVAIGFFVSSLVAPRLLGRFDRAVLAAGAVGLSVSTGLLGAVVLDGGMLPLALVLAMVPVLFLCGTGYGLVIPTLLGVILRAMPSEHSGEVAGVLVTTQQVAGAIGVALSGVLFFGLLHRAEPPSYASSFAFALGFNVVVFLATALMVRILSRDTRWTDGAAG